MENRNWITTRPSAFNMFSKTTAKHFTKVKPEDTRVGEEVSSSSGRANTHRGDGCTGH